LHLLVELGALLLIVRQAQAARPPERIAAELFDAVEVALGPHPVRASALGAEPFLRFRVGHGSSAQGEASVPPTRTFGDPSRFV